MSMISAGSKAKRLRGEQARVRVHGPKARRDVPLGDSKHSFNKVGDEYRECVGMVMG